MLTAAVVYLYDIQCPCTLKAGNKSQGHIRNLFPDSIWLQLALKVETDNEVCHVYLL